MKNNQEEEIKSNVAELSLYSPNCPFNLPLRIRNFEDEKDFNKFIKNCEKMVRGSLEYKAWRNYITDILSFNSCVITDENIDELSIDIHHHIPSLFIVIKTITNKWIENNKEFSSFDISLETVEVHFKNLIGYIPIIKSLHEKFHNGFLSVPINSVKGNYVQFLNDYGKYIDPEDSEVIDQRMSVKESNNNWNKDNYLTYKG